MGLENQAPARVNHEVAAAAGYYDDNFQGIARFSLKPLSSLSRMHRLVELPPRCTEGYSNGYHGVQVAVFDDLTGPFQEMNTLQDKMSKSA